MKRTLIAGICSLAILAGCTAQQATQTNAALAATAAVAADIVSLEQQVQASGTNVTPAEAAALTNALMAAQQGVAALLNDPTAGAAVFSKIELALQEVVPFIPAVAALIASLATPGQPAVLGASAASYPALVQLQGHLAELHAAAR